LAIGKRVVFISDKDYTNQNAPYLFPVNKFWQEFEFDELVPFPICNPKLNVSLGVNLTRLHADALQFAWFYGHPENTSAASIAKGVDCNFNYVSIDLLTPTTVKGFVWTWKEGEPSKGCTLLESSSGKWVSVPCNRTNYCAFQNHVNASDWQISKQQVVFNQCNSLTPSGYNFILPMQPFHNRKLKSIAGTRNVWLNFIAN